MEWLTAASWSPYAVGAGIGALSWLTFLLSDRAIGCSTAFARTSGMLERLVRGRAVDEKPYYRQFAPMIDWEWMLVAGIVIGAAASALLSQDLQWRWVPPLWEASFGPAPVPRIAAALFGGFCIGLGSRWAGGCTSGHGISGTMQLGAASWIAAICFFVGGVAVAHVLFRLL
ncbi:MAG: YeeE/YedE thiosulfate transporter family protein [Candidatus Krumholzibacteria bacterium]|nr:YeeE/YedE thiosulfate transporter family protein [Candidatus Krumholzibacteria bacterium]